MLPFRRRTLRRGGRKRACWVKLFGGALRPRGALDSRRQSASTAFQTRCVGAAAVRSAGGVPRPWACRHASWKCLGLRRKSVSSSAGCVVAGVLVAVLGGIGGDGAGGAGGAALRSVEMCDPLIDRAWVTLPPMKQSRQQLAAVAVGEELLRASDDTASSQGSEAETRCSAQAQQLGTRGAVERLRKLHRRPRRPRRHG